MKTDVNILMQATAAGIVLCEFSGIMCEQVVSQPLFPFSATIETVWENSEGFVHQDCKAYFYRIL
jgi:hypothetical protein